MKKKVLLIGGFNKTKSLAQSLLKQGYRVTVINENYQNCLDMAEIDGVNVFHGDGTKPFILDEAGAEGADYSIALSARDEDNLVTSQLCKNMFHVKKTVSLLSDPHKTDFFYEAGIDSVVCVTQAITNIIEQQTFVEEMTNIIPIGKGCAQIVEVKIPDRAPVTGKKLWEIPLPSAVVIGCILRGDTTIIPRGDTRIFAGDTLVVIADSGQELAAIKELTGR